MKTTLYPADATLNYWKEIGSGRYTGAYAVVEVISGRWDGLYIAIKGMPFKPTGRIVVHLTKSGLLRFWECEVGALIFKGVPKYDE